MTETLKSGERDIAASVIVCTRDRAALLGACLQGVLMQTFDSSAFEVVIVDNASTDDTPEVVASFLRLLPSAKYCYEPRVGLPFARNTGWRNARGRIACFVDDDAIPDPGWLTGLLSAYEKFWDGESSIAMGGGVRNHFIGCAGYPDWMPERYRDYLTRLDYGGSSRALLPGELLVGANFSVPVQVLERVDGFHEGLCAYGMDERWIEQMVLRHGGRLIWCAESWVSHAVPSDRLTKRWLLERMNREGRAVFRYCLLGSRFPLLFKIKSALPSCFRLSYRWMRRFSLFRSTAGGRLDHETLYCYYKGFFYELISSFGKWK